MGAFLLENANPDFLVQNRIFRSFFFGWGGGGEGVYQARILNPESPRFGWISRIKYKSGFLRFTV